MKSKSTTKFVEPTEVLVETTTAFDYAARIEDDVEETVIEAAEAVAEKMVEIEATATVEPIATPVTTKRLTSVSINKAFAEAGLNVKLTGANYVIKLIAESGAEVTVPQIHYNDLSLKEWIIIASGI